MKVNYLDSENKKRTKRVLLGTNLIGWRLTGVTFELVDFLELLSKEDKDIRKILEDLYVRTVPRK